MLLVGSVYLDHVRSRQWYELQTTFLKKTTFDFEHIVYLNGMDNFFNRSRVLKADTQPANSGQEYHIRGLNAIISYFNDHSEYDSLLLLDNDCFPIHGKWQNKLIDKMGDFQVAAIARYENLDTFAHPSAFFVKRDAAKNLLFGEFSQTNIVDFTFADTSSNVTKFFPLIRSNKVNYHPVLFGVYWNIFYHHGAGSRDLTFRLLYHYFNESVSVNSLEVDCFNKLVKTPIDFLTSINEVSLNVKMF